MYVSTSDSNLPMLLMGKSKKSSEACFLLDFNFPWRLTTLTTSEKKRHFIKKIFFFRKIIRSKKFGKKNFMNFSIFAFSSILSITASFGWEFATFLRIQCAGALSEDVYKLLANNFNKCINAGRGQKFIRMVVVGFCVGYFKKFKRNVKKNPTWINNIFVCKMYKISF